MPTGYELGLVSEEIYADFLKRMEQKTQEIERVNNTFLAPNPDLTRILEENGTAQMTTGMRLSDLIKRPQLSYDLLAPFDKERPELPKSVREKVEVEIK